MMSNLLGCASYSRTSKLTDVPSSTSSERHSMLKIRLGEEPLVDVNMPSPASTEIRSSQCTRMAPLKPEYGRQGLLNSVLLLLNWILPFVLTLTLVYDWL